MRKTVKPFVVLALFSLGLYACGDNQVEETETKDEGKPATPKTHEESVALGELTFKAQCMLCHGADGKLGASGSKDLSVSTLSEQDAINLVSYGRGGMMAYKDLLTKDQIENVVAYIQTLRKK